MYWKVACSACCVSMRVHNLFPVFLAQPCYDHCHTPLLQLLHVPGPCQQLTKVHQRRLQHFRKCLLRQGVGGRNITVQKVKPHWSFLCVYLYSYFFLSNIFNFVSSSLCMICECSVYCLPFLTLLSVLVWENWYTRKVSFVLSAPLWTSSYMSFNDVIAFNDVIVCVHTDIIDAHLTLLQCTCSKAFVTDMEFSFVLLCLTLLDSVTPVSSAAQVKPVLSILEIFKKINSTHTQHHVF